MKNEPFRNQFSEVARRHEFVAAYGGWFRESSECVVVLALQKSNFGNYFELNIKVFVKGFFNRSYSRRKQMVKRDVGNVFLRPPARFSPALNLEEPSKHFSSSSYGRWPTKLSPATV